MKSIGNKSDNKGYVRFCEDNHLIVAGVAGSECFYVNKDGSSSLGAGKNGMSFFCLNDTPDKPEDKKILGINGEKVGYLSDIEVNSILAEELKVKAHVAFTASVKNQVSDKITTDDLVTDTLHVTKHLDAERLNVEDLIGKELKATNVITNNVFSLETAHLADVEMIGRLHLPTVKIGSVDEPLKLCKAERYNFDLTDAKQLELTGRHYNARLEFVVKSELKDLFDHVIDVHVLHLTGEEVAVHTKMVSKVDDNTFKVKLEFDKKVDDKHELLERITVRLL